MKEVNLRSTIPRYNGLHTRLYSVEKKYMEEKTERTAFFFVEKYGECGFNSGGVVVKQKRSPIASSFGVVTTSPS